MVDRHVAEPMDWDQHRDGWGMEKKINSVPASMRSELATILLL